MSVTKQVSLHGTRAYLTKDDQLVGRNGVGAGGAGKPFIQVPGSPDTVAFFDDFLVDHTIQGDTGGFATFWLDTGSAASAHVAGPNGVHRITPTAVDVDDPHVIVGRQLDWKPNQGPGDNSGRLRMSARVKKSTYTGGYQGIFVGFTDVAAAEMPFHDTGGAAGTADKATASNGFGVMWNASGAEAGWVGVAVDGDSYQEDVLTTTAPTDDTWVVIESEVSRGAADTGGTASFWIDGVSVGSIDNPCNVSTALTPIIAVYDTGGAATVDVDWVAVSAPRD